LLQHANRMPDEEDFAEPNENRILSKYDDDEEIALERKKL